MNYFFMVVLTIIKVVNVFAILSTLALSCIFIRVLSLAGLRLLGHDVAPSFFNTQLGYYAACLLIANMINGVAGLIGVRSLVERGITESEAYAICPHSCTLTLNSLFTDALCTAQGTW
jgi:hypothetical protein